MCELCELGEGLKITICRTCGVPMVVSCEHKPEFSTEERAMIERLFYGRGIRWEMRSIKNHAHCHID